MGRHRKWTHIDAAKVWVTLWQALGRRPTVQAFAERLDVDDTTAQRYLKLIDHVVICPKCKGQGWVAP